MKKPSFEEWVRFKVYANFWHNLNIFFFLTPIWFDIKFKDSQCLSYKITQARSDNLQKAYKLLEDRKWPKKIGGLK